MARFFCFILFILVGVYAQENAVRNVPSSLRECYNNKYLVERDNRLPHTLNALLAIIRKIENTEGLNMDIRTLSVALLHRFRQDGIVPNPTVSKQDGVTPYAPNAFQFFRFAQTLRFIPGNAMSFPNASITDVERCTLHFMFSSSVELFERGDEGRVCRYANAPYRNVRSIDEEDVTNRNTSNDVETLSPDEIELITNQKDSGAEGTVDPNSVYPELPPNHPSIARISTYPRSKCPVENGIVKTPWGPLSMGLVLAGIAAGLQPQTVSLRDLHPDVSQQDKYPANVKVDNKWIATLAGDLAEVALRQRPESENLVIGVPGNWNSTIMPRWYFLNSNEKYEYTTAEVRGGLDGLILATEISKWYSKIPSLRLSQVLDMYYSARGLFDRETRACNRRTLFTAVAPNSTMSAQAYSAALELCTDLAMATLESTPIEKFAVDAVNEFVTYVPTMNKDVTCEQTDKLNDLNQLSTHLTIILDTKWPFSGIKTILTNLLDNMEINQFNSNFTLINGYDGIPMINSSNNLLDFLAFNSSHYENVTAGFDLPKALERLDWLLKNKLNNERVNGIGGARSDVVLIVPYISSISKPDKEYCLQTITRMREETPDTKILILAYGSKDTWSDFVQDPSTDLFSIGIGDTEEALTPLTSVVSRIKQVPKRLINTQCGADYSATGTSEPYVDYIEPFGVNYYRLHPNYFYSSDSDHISTIKIEASSTDGLTVCSSRELLHVNTTENIASASCTTINSGTHSISISCGDVTFIHECQPLYIAISSNSTNPTYQCTDGRVCRFPNLIKYTVSYENLVCVSGASRHIVSIVILILALAYLNL